MTRHPKPMRIRLGEQRRADLLRSMQHFCLKEYQLELSDFQANGLLDFMIKELGAPVYNQAIQDARGFFLDKLSDLEGEFYEPED